MAAVDVWGRGSAIVYRWRHAAGVGTCGKVWGHVAWVVAGCGGMWQGSGYMVGVRLMVWMGTCDRVGDMW